MQPLDLVKTRLQQHVQQAGSSLRHHDRTGMVTVFRQVLQNDSVTGLWRGISPSIARTVPGVGIYFCSLHWLKTSSGEGEGATPSPLKAIALGMAARTVAGAIMIPITVVKTRYESGIYDYKRISHALGSIYSKEGLRGLSCGLVPTLFRDAPYSGLYFMFYTQLKRHIGADGGNSALYASSANFSCGVLAGFCASLVTHPFDVIKTKMQLRPEQYSSVVQTAVLVARTQGPAGFLVGLAPRMIRRACMSALAWTVYEEVMRQIGLK